MSFNSYAKLSNRKYLEVIKSCIDVGLPVRAVKSSPTSVYFSSVGEYMRQYTHRHSWMGRGLLTQWKPVLFATRRGTYIATFYISCLQLKTWSKRLHHRIRFGGPWAHILRFAQFLGCLEELTRRLLSSFWPETSWLCHNFLLPVDVWA